MEMITNTANEVLVNLALGIITLLAAYAMYYIRLGTAQVQAQTAKIRDDASRKRLQDALADVEGLALLSVSAVEQTTAKALREQIRIGEADRDALLAIGQQVFADVKAALAPKTKMVIQKNLGSFDSYLEKCIEDAVRKVKQEGPYIAIPGEILNA